MTRAEGELHSANKKTLITNEKHTYPLHSAQFVLWLYCCYSDLTKWDCDSVWSGWRAIHQHAGESGGCIPVYRVGGTGRFSGRVGCQNFQCNLANRKAAGFAG